MAKEMLWCEGLILISLSCIPRSSGMYIRYIDEDVAECHMCTEL